MENRNLQWSKRAKVPLILIFSVNTNHESVAYRSFSPSEFEARGARKVTTGIAFCNSPRRYHQYRLVDPRQWSNRERVVRPFFGWGVPRVIAGTPTKKKGCLDVRQHNWMRESLVKALGTKRGRPKRLALIDYGGRG
jgi:hypothetical protein